MIDIVGAGDHLHKVDARIRRLKEMMRCVIDDLPYSLPVLRRDDLVIYVTSRKNSRKTKALSDNVSPRVKFTGLKVNYQKEYEIDFGDYVEAYIPNVESKTMATYSEPCIALYPARNISRSWILSSLKRIHYVRRTNYKKLHTTPHVINVMNALAGVTGIKSAEQVSEDQQDSI